ncbi:MAG: hypothetical protein IH964_09900 [Candidatus Dadabacteria bacterium]|nr:hypothetical protein [Candidatus Dadabacteria bacterium]
MEGTTYGGNVSLGFLNVYIGTDSNPIESTILSKIDELTMTGNFNNLFITGHSLGAALAFLAFPDFSQNVGMIDSVTMYNFAGPAVGDSQFVSTYEGEQSLNRISVPYSEYERPRSQAASSRARLPVFFIRACRWRAEDNFRNPASSASRFRKR